MFSIVNRWPFLIYGPSELEMASKRAMDRFAHAERRAQDPADRDTLSEIGRNIGDIRARAGSIDK